MTREQNDAFAARTHAGVALGLLEESERYAGLADTAVDPAFAVTMTNMSVRTRASALEAARLAKTFIDALIVLLERSKD